ncbi:hypothetical protein PQX77_007708, partial [Marasmius sp. AFHP31]
MAIYTRLSEDLDRVHNTVEYEAEDNDGNLKTYVNNMITDDNMWREFRLKWKFPRSVDLNWLEDSY